MLSLLWGCGSPDTCHVEGNVSFAGQQVAVGLIEFEPADGSSQAYAIPIQAGHYETPATLRILPGMYIVRITAPDPATNASNANIGPNDPVPDTRPLLPPSWNARSTLRLRLEAGTNRVSFRGDADPQIEVESH